MAKKEITHQFKIQAPGGVATPAPPIGPALGQYGVNPGQFIQQFNAATQAIKGKVVGVVITVYKDRTFTFEIKSSPASVLLTFIVSLFALLLLTVPVYRLLSALFLPQVQPQQGTWDANGPEFVNPVSPGPTGRRHVEVKIVE